jgi:hypothetical protein
MEKRTRTLKQKKVKTMSIYLKYLDYFDEDLHSRRKRRNSSSSAAARKLKKVFDIM